MGYPAWPAGRTCISFIQFYFLVMGRDVANPRTTTVVAIGNRNVDFTRLSQSEIYLDYSFDIWLSYYLMAILVTMDISENFNYSNPS